MPEELHPRRCWLDRERPCVEDCAAWIRSEPTPCSVLHSLSGIRHGCINSAGALAEIRELLKPPISGTTLKPPKVGS